MGAATRGVRLGSEPWALGRLGWRGRERTGSLRFGGGGALEPSHREGGAWRCVPRWSVAYGSSSASISSCGITTGGCRSVGRGGRLPSLPGDGHVGRRIVSGIVRADFRGALGGGGGGGTLLLEPLPVARASRISLGVWFPNPPAFSERSTLRASDLYSAVRSSVASSTGISISGVEGAADAATCCACRSLRKSAGESAWNGCVRSFSGSE